MCKILIGAIYKKLPFLTIYLKQNINNISEKFTSSFKNFQIEKLGKHYSDSENSFNLDYFVYFSSNYVNFVFNDIIALGK